MNNDNIIKRLLLTVGIPALIAVPPGIVLHWSWFAILYPVVLGLQFFVAWILKYQAERKNIAEMDKDALEVLKIAQVFQKQAKCSICHRSNMVKLDLSSDGTPFKCPCGAENKLVVYYNVVATTKVVTEEDMEQTASKLQLKLKELNAENNVEP